MDKKKRNRKFNKFLWKLSILKLLEKNNFINNDKN